MPRVGEAINMGRSAGYMRARSKVKRKKGEQPRSRFLEPMGNKVVYTAESVRGTVPRGFFSMMKVGKRG